MTEKLAFPDVVEAQFAIGDVVRHRIFDFRGVVFDIDPVFANSDEWYESIPEPVRPAKNQPFYHLFAENAESSYIAYVSQQNLLADVEPFDASVTLQRHRSDPLFQQFDTFGMGSRSAEFRHCYARVGAFHPVN
jgi:heat shock protein HspQ